MASKTTKRANAAVKGKGNAPRVKDDGRRFVLVHSFEGVERQVYPGPGVMLADAEQLAAGLVEKVKIVEVTKETE